MGIPFAQGTLSPLDGELFLSHKKRVDEMKVNWDAYPFADYELQSRSKKLYRFRKIYAECPCGRKANLKCIVEKCRRCCHDDPGICKVHKKNKPLPVQDCLISS